MKIFRNKSDYQHFFIPGVLMALTVLLWLAPRHTVADVFTVLLTLTVFTSPWWWEMWDKYKVKYDDPRAFEWSHFVRQIFTSEGFFDPHDMLLGFAGIFTAFAFLWLMTFIF